MTTTAPRWRGLSPEQRRIQMQKVSDGRRRAALDRKIDVLAAHAAILSDAQRARLAVLAMPAAGGSE